jgi:hypothetical protein
VTGAAIGRTGAVSEKAGPTIGTAKGQYLASRTDIAVLLPLIAEGFAGNLPLVCSDRSSTGICGMVPRSVTNARNAALP